MVSPSVRVFNSPEGLFLAIVINWFNCFNGVAGKIDGEQQVKVIVINNS